MKLAYETTEYEAGKLRLMMTYADEARNALSELKAYAEQVGMRATVKDAGKALERLEAIQRDTHHEREQLAKRKAIHDNRSK